jgi:S-adenosylmethionine/arginine decarboxylase-like enzyme
MVTQLAPMQATDPWGLMTSVNLYDCDPASIRSAETIKRYVVELCELIGMKRFGECQIVHFGKDVRVEGFSMIQLIETSLISGHFANLANAAYIDVFSCKPYEPNEVADFSKGFFRAESVQLHVLERN